MKEMLKRLDNLMRDRLLEPDAIEDLAFTITKRNICVTYLFMYQAYQSFILL
jgi:hypothetical protein